MNVTAICFVEFYVLAFWIFGTPFNIFAEQTGIRQLPGLLCLLIEIYLNMILNYCPARQEW